MKLTSTIALMLTFGAAALYAEPTPVKMTFSGNAGPSSIDLKRPNTATGEENLAGSGTLGQFTFRLVKASDSAPQPSNTCFGPTTLYFPNEVGAGLFRFADGSLLSVNLISGGDCINFGAGEAHCTLTFQITGGTGRFQGATGVLNFSETAVPILGDGSTPSNPVFFTEVGEFTGMISRGDK